MVEAAPSRGREVATVLVAVGRDRASRLLSHFEPDEIKRLQAIGQGDEAQGRRLPNVSAEELKEIVERFERIFEDGPGVVGARSSFEALLLQTTIDAADEPVPASAPPPSGEDTARAARWAAVAEASEADLATWLAEENEAVAALVVARLPSALSAALLTRVSPEVCGAIVGALPHADASPAAEDLVLDLIEAELVDGEGGKDTAQTQSVLAGIVNELDPEIGERVTKRLSDAMTAEQMEGVSARIFRFEDLPRVDAIGRLTLLGELPADRIVLALDGAEGELREAVLSSLGQRMRRMVESELEAGIPARPDAVKSARRSIAARVIALAREGGLELPKAA